MSFSTDVYLHLENGSLHSRQETIVALEKFIKDSDLHSDVIKDVNDSFSMHTYSSTLFHLEPWSIIDMFTLIASTNKELAFHVKGIGDLGAGDIWVREFANGETIFSQGPFEEKLDI